jgi:hypothetical protein
MFGARASGDVLFRVIACVDAPPAFGCPVETASESDSPSGGTPCDDDEQPKPAIASTKHEKTRTRER